MAETTYTYGIAADMPVGGVNPATLFAEIEASAIATALVDVNTKADVLKIVFADALSAGDKTTLDNDTTGPAGGLLAAHDNAPTADTDEARFAAGDAGGGELNLPEYTADPASPLANDCWIRNTSGTRRFIFYDGATKHAVVLTAE